MILASRSFLPIRRQGLGLSRKRVILAVKGGINGILSYKCLPMPRSLEPSLSFDLFKRASRFSAFFSHQPFSNRGQISWIFHRPSNRDAAMRCNPQVCLKPWQFILVKPEMKRIEYNQLEATGTLAKTETMDWTEYWFVLKTSNWSETDNT